jgi:hypothetical protein
LAAVSHGASSRQHPPAEDEGLSSGEDDGDDDGEEDRVDEDGMDYTPGDDLPPKKKRRRRERVWRPNAPTPTFTPGAAYALVELATISNHLSELNHLIFHLGSDSQTMSDYIGDSLEAVVGRVRIWERITASYDLLRIADYMKLALHFDKLKISLSKWCAQCGVVYQTAWRWKSIGLQFLQLVAGGKSLFVFSHEQDQINYGIGTIYILPIIATLDLRVYFQTLGVYDLQLLCGMLRRPSSEWFYILICIFTKAMARRCEWQHGEGINHPCHSYDDGQCHCGEGVGFIV